MRRATRPRQPNQRTCKHDFYKLYTVRENDNYNHTPLVRTIGRRGVTLSCAKCALVRTVFDDGTMRDGGVQRVERMAERAATTGFAAVGVGGQGIQFFDDNAVALGAITTATDNRRDQVPAARPLNAAERLDAEAAVMRHTIDQAITEQHGLTQEN